MAKLSENTKKIFDFVKANESKNITANDVAEQLGLAPRAVNGSITAMQKKGLMVRVPAEIAQEDGTHKPIKLIQLTDEGRSFDPEAVEEEVAE